MLLVCLQHAAFDVLVSGPRFYRWFQAMNAISRHSDGIGLELANLFWHSGIVSASGLYLLSSHGSVYRQFMFGEKSTVLKI